MKAVNEYWVKLKTFSKECRRVLKVTKKPNWEEYKTVTKITGIGMVVIGLIGFIITIMGKAFGL